MALLLPTVLFVVIAAAFFATIEAALFSTSLPRAQVLKRQGRLGATALVSIRENMSRPITALVIGNNAATIVGSIIVGHVATEQFGDAYIGFITAAITVLIIVFGEVFPKVLGERFCDTISLATAGPLKAFTFVLSPIIWIIEKGTSRFTRDRKKIVSEEELKILSEIGSKEGSIERDEEELIRRAFTLNDMTAKDIMTPWKAVDALLANRTVQEIASGISHKPYSRYPVTDDAGEVVGLVHAKDLLISLAWDGAHEPVSHFMAPALSVNERKRVDDLLALFLSQRDHLAVVRNEAGKHVGVVTLEDVMEQLVGEIMDETDEVTDLRTQSPIA